MYITQYCHRYHASHIRTYYFIEQEVARIIQRWALNSVDPCSVQTDSLTDKHLDTKDVVHHPVYDYSHYIVKIKSLAMCAL